MEQDPEGPGQEPDQTPQEPGGSPPPQEGEPPRDEGDAGLKSENQRLRERLRQEMAKRLAKEHELGEVAAGLLLTVPQNEMEAKAAALAAEIQASQPPPPAPPQEPAETKNLTAMDDDRGKPKVTTPPGPDDEELKAMHGAKSFEEIERLQAAKQAERQAAEGGPPTHAGSG